MSAISGASLLCWLLQKFGAIPVLPTSVVMTPSTAVALLIFGICLWRLRSEGANPHARHWAGVFLAGLVAIFGFYELVVGVFGLASAGARGPNSFFENPGPNTAFGLICCGGAMVLCQFEKRRCLVGAQALAMLAGLAGLLALVGYSYRVSPLYQFGSARPMALSTAFGLALFCIGLLAAKPDRGLLMVLTSGTTGGALARRLLGLAILIPWMLGALLLAGESRGHYQGKFGLAVFAIMSIIIFTLLIWWNAKLLHDADIKREQTEEQLREASANLERSNAELQQFAYLASHDLSEPLRTVISYLQLLSARYSARLDKGAQEFINFAVDGALRMQALIKDLLAYSRVGTSTPAFEPVEAEDVLKSALSNLKVAVEESGAVVTHEPLPRVWGDPVQITQVFQNLIGNAIKFRGPEPPRIKVGAVPQEHEVHFFVQDNGIGIDPKFFERIFEIFQRLHTRQVYSGTGIGLAICKRIVERHHGRIWVESSPGKGSTFWFSLPTDKRSSAG